MTRSPCGPRAVLVVLGVGTLLGCRHGEQPPATSIASVTGADLGSSSNDDAVMRIATARCERELACNKIGEGRAYEDQPTCLAEMGELMDEEAGRSTCPRGVDPLEVSRCQLDIQRTECGGELEREMNVPSCTKAALCVR